MICTLLILITLSIARGHECPDHKSCNDDATCCQLYDKSYACCPLKNAVCCDDHIHCCPENTKCAQNMCIQQDYVKQLGHTVFSKIKISNGTCDDGETACSSNIPGIYICCPLPNAVCCDDSHCCPEGMVCNLEKFRCDGKDFVVNSYNSNKLKSNYAALKPLYKSKNVTKIICPGGEFQCPNGYTCCLLPSGDWGCCPFPQAVCCKDHLHCCPESMQCDASSQSCRQGLTRISALKKILAEPIDITTSCPDKTQCSDSKTCCPLNERHYGCCIYQNGVCCSDHRHCCPNGYVCDVAERRCLKPE